MLTGGGCSLEDLRMIHRDKGLRSLLHLDHLPSTDAAGDWLRRTGEGEGMVGLDRVNRRIVVHCLHQYGCRTHTLDIDATQIVAEKRDAAWTYYKGERGYMPMVGHLAEAGVVIHDDFRAGNVAPASANLDFEGIAETDACLVEIRDLQVLPGLGGIGGIDQAAVRDLVVLSLSDGERRTSIIMRRALRNPTVRARALHPLEAG